MSIIAMIPARMGSERLKLKNLALLNGKPLISYAIEAAKQSGIFEKVVLNSDGEIFRKVAQRYGVDFYHRPEKLGSSETKSDDVVYDFMLAHPSDIVAWVNPISPLQTGDEVRKVISYFVDHELDSLITVKDEKVHCVYQDKPVNFTLEGQFAKTQDLTPVQSFVYSIMMWRSEPFKRAYENQGYALMSGKLGYFPVSDLSAIIIKTDADLLMAESMLRAGSGSRGVEVHYDQLVGEA